MTERTRARLLQAAADGAITGELDALMIRGRPARPNERAAVITLIAEAALVMDSDGRIAPATLVLF